MSDYKSLSHSKWDYKYHIVFIPKCHRKKLYGEIRSYLSKIFHDGERLWARGYVVSTVGFNEAQIRSYIQNQEQLDGFGENESGSF